MVCPAINPFFEGMLVDSLNADFLGVKKSYCHFMIDLCGLCPLVDGLGESNSILSYFAGFDIRS